MSRARFRSVRPSAACALTLSLCVLAACTSPQGTLIANRETGGAVPPGGNVVSPGGGNANPQAALSFTAIKGQATFHGQPLANAEIRLLDARTDLPAGVIAAGGGNVIAPGGGNVIAPGGGNVIAPGGGNVIAPGGGNVIAPGGGNVIAPGGGNVIAPGGGNVIAPGGGNVIAPGGGNVIAAGGGNVIAVGGGNLRTDSQGNFNLNVAGLTGGNAARLVVVAGGNALSTIVAGGGGPGGYRTLQAEGGGVAVNEATTAVSHLAYGSLRLTRLVKPSAAAPIIRQVLDGLQAEADKYAAEFERQPAMANQLVEETDPTTGGPRHKAKGSIMPTLLGNTNTKKRVFALNKDALSGIARAASNPETQAPDLEQAREEVQDVPLVGTGLNASAEAGAITLATETGQTVSLSLTDSSQLDSALSSGTFEKAFTPPVTTSGSSGAAPSPSIAPSIAPSPTAGTITLFNTSAALPTAAPGKLTRDQNGFFWLTQMADNSVKQFDYNAASSFKYADNSNTQPSDVAANSTHVWATFTSSNLVVRYDTSVPPSPVPPTAYFNVPNVGGAIFKPKHIAVSASEAWVTDWGVNGIARFNGSTFDTPLVTTDTTKFFVPSPDPAVTQPGGIGIASNGWVWTISRTSSRLMIVNATGATYNTPLNNFPVLAGNPLASPEELVVDQYDRVWVSDTTTNRVIRFEHATNTLDVWNVAVGPTQMAPSGVGMWVLAAGSNNLVHIQPGAAMPLCSIPLGYTAGSLTSVSGYAYVLDVDSRQVKKYQFTP